MYHILSETKGHIIGIHIEGYMTFQDEKTLLPYLRNRIEQLGTIRILLELKNFSGIRFLGILKTIFFSLKYGRHIEKKAILTDEDWVYNWVKFLFFFSKTKIRCFPSSKVAQAWEWVKK